MGTGTVQVPVPRIVHFSGGIGTGIGKIWYWKKVSEPVSEKFDTGTDFCRQNLGILKIYYGYRYRIGTGTENQFFLLYRNWYRKKVLEPVAIKFGTEKGASIGIEKNWYRKKVSVSVSSNIQGTVTQWHQLPDDNDDDDHDDDHDVDDDGNKSHNLVQQEAL